jgi:hypothetical protein
MIITWEIADPREKSQTGFELEVGEDDRFEQNRRNFTVTLKSHILYARKPLCDLVIYARVRAIHATSEAKTYGEWSTTSEKWLSTVDACGRSDLFLNCSRNDNPAEWRCDECPVGAFCEGPVRWSQVKARAGYWRDDRIKNRTDPRFVPEAHKFLKCKNPKACVGADLGDDNHLNVSESCAPGYKQFCNNTAQCEPPFSYLEMCNATTCRQCQTCDYGYAMDSDGVTCTKCTPPGSDDRVLALVLTTLVFVVVLVFFSMLVFLKIKSATSHHDIKTKAAHSTIKRILLSHVQIIMLSLSLNVPWPPLIKDLMTALSAVSSVSQHVARVGCFVDTEEPVLKQARFLYASSISIALFPIGFAGLMYVYWLVLVPLPCFGKFLACGQNAKIYMSDPVPNALRKVCCKGSGEHENDGHAPTEFPMAANPMNSGGDGGGGKKIQSISANAIATQICHRSRDERFARQDARYLEL